MRLNLVAIILVIGILPQKSSKYVVLAHDIPIVTVENHSLLLHRNNLNEILSVDSIKDRFIVVVSIAGAFQPENTFLLSSFVRYLNARYKRHNATDSMDQNSTEFEWRNDRKSDTIGVWMWSEVFTHDFDNGDKVAIVLLDIQSAFHVQSTSVRDYVSIFALSSMLSSVQCLNVVNNIDEDDLQYLDLITEYGRLSANISTSKSHQYFLFVVHNWPVYSENGYGWNGQNLIDGLFNETTNHTIDMRQLHQRIQSNYIEIGAFLFPCHGIESVTLENCAGHLQSDDSNDRFYVEDLVVSLLAPENLVVMEINGQKMRAIDFVEQFQMHLQMFNEETKPELDRIFTALPESQSHTLLMDTVNFYTRTIQISFDQVKTYYSPSQLKALHDKTKSDAISQFQAKSTLRSELMVLVQRKIERTISEQFEISVQKNEMKRTDFIERINLYNENLIDEIKKSFDVNVQNGIENRSMDENEFDGYFVSAVDNALHEFDIRVLIHGNLASCLREKLSNSMNEARAHFQHINELNRWRRPLRLRHRTRKIQFT